MPDHQLSYLPPDASPAERQRHRDEGATLVGLQRRGVHLGYLVRRGLPEQPEDLAPLWRGTRPIHLPGVLAGGLEVFETEIAASVEMFERLRKGGRFLDELTLRMEDQDSIVPAGSTFDRADEREIEKVWLRAVEDGEVVADELWAKLSWIAHDEADASLRIAYSFGYEQLQDWRGDASRAPFADAACEDAFPECGTITGHLPLVAALEELLETRLRFSERILYSNAAGGGAVFHQDVEPEQRGVIFGQFAGRTAWMALPKRELAALMMSRAKGDLAQRVSSQEGVWSVLADEADPERFALLNQDPGFTRALVEAGAAYLLEPGDALILPNQGEEDTCWHSVFAVGHKSLGHSYGLFPAG